MKRDRRGQSLAEVLIATALGAIIIGAVIASIILSMRSNSQTRTSSVAASLGTGLLDNVQALADGNWDAIFNLQTKGSTSTYYLVTTGTPPTIAVSTGTESLTVSSTTFTRYFSVQDVNRTNCGTGSITTSSATGCAGGSGILQDPSTELITVSVSWSNIGGGSSSVAVSSYVTHSKDRVTQYNDWSGSSGTQGPVTTPAPDYATSSNVSTSSSGLQLLVY